jgi:hypothetical protein
MHHAVTSEWLFQFFSKGIDSLVSCMPVTNTTASSEFSETTPSKNEPPQFRAHKE